MCTVTFIARKNGYALGMNRDEKHSRVEALPPKLHIADGVKVLCPFEPGGGTWIALNEAGVTIALINWYSIKTPALEHPVSRGEVVKALGSTACPQEVDAKLQHLPLKHIHPFRLVGIFPAAAEIIEWRWNLKQLIRKRATWMTQQWISSGYDELTAQRVRGEEFRRAAKAASAPNLGWLRKLHRSHAPSAGPFSTCMHRAEASTVSYTEITVSSRTATLRYHRAAPCQKSAKTEPFILPLTR